MADCKSEFRDMVPLYRVVGAAIADTGEDFGKVEQLYSHWAVRGLKNISRQMLNTGKRKAILVINKNTRSAGLPIDCKEVISAYVIENGMRVRLTMRNDIVDESNTPVIECEDKCPKCNQDKSFCQDLIITETTSIVVINGSNYEQTVTKKLYPDGRYYLETRIPVLDLNNDSVIYTTTKDFITQIDLKPCGCIENSNSNIQKIKKHCYDTYCTDCSVVCDKEYGGCRVFEESQIIQLDHVGDFTKVCIEYWGVLPKKNGNYMVPEVIFETLVNWIKFKRVENKRNIPLIERGWTLDQFKRERKNFEKIIGRISLSQIMDAATLIPKFDLQHPVCDPVFSYSESDNIESSVESSVNEVQQQIVSTVSSSSQYVPFSISTTAGDPAPVVGTNSYYSDKLKKAINISIIIVNNSSETKKELEWKIDSVNGILYRYQGDGVTPNEWGEGDVLVIPTFFKSLS